MIDFPQQTVPSHEVQLVRGESSARPEVNQAPWRARSFRTSDYVLIAQANTGKEAVASSIEKFDTVFEECQPVETQVPPGGLDFSPNGGVMNYWDSYPKHRVGSGILRDAKVTVLQGPSLGTLVPLSRLSRDVGQVFAYNVRPGVPNGSEDRISFLIEFEGKRIKVNEVLKIVFNSTPESKDCKGKDYYIKRIR